MVVVNTENIPGREYQVISLVTGCCVMEECAPSKWNVR